MLSCAAIIVAACAHMAAQEDATPAAVALMKKDFKSRGQATLDRLDQDELAAQCTRYAREPMPKDLEARIEKEQLEAVKYPADGKYLGDWKAGEAVAQSGVGKQWSDDPSKPSGGNCYACHELSDTELSFGTIGPSLRNYGKLRGNSPEMQRYTFAKVYNSQAFVACSSMPRFGHKGILTEKQIKDVVALLLDPASPVNK
ncbi:MAG: sulfur oxidation c-type cytochrome SoxX [Bacillota bacterium]